MSGDRPAAVTVGVPTFNRATTLGRAVESALAQEEVRLEVVISDNASDDATAAVCRRLAAGDERVRVLRQARNAGARANLRAVLDEARTPYFMWLADDDWLEPGAIRACLEAVEQGHALAAPTIAYFDSAGEFAFAEPPVNARSRRPGLRVLQYYGTLTRNGVFYGLGRTEWIRAAPFPARNAGDWHFVASLAAAGPVATVPGARLNRTLGPSEDPLATAATSGATGFRARQQHLWIAAALALDVSGRDPAFGRIGPAPRRAFVGAAAAAIVFVKFSLQVWLIDALRAAGLLPWASALRARLRSRRDGAGSPAASGS